MRMRAMMSLTIVLLVLSSGGLGDVGGDNALAGLARIQNGVKSKRISSYDRSAGATNGARTTATTTSSGATNDSLELTTVTWKETRR